MNDQNQSGLIGILNSADPHETPRSDFMKIVLIPFLSDLPLGVYFTGTYGEQMKFIPRSAIPEEFRKELRAGGMYVVAGNLMTKYSKDICFTSFEQAPEPCLEYMLG